MFTMHRPLTLVSLLTLLRLIIGSKSQQQDLQLELASVVFRHGDRSPISTFPTDRYSESDWPQGYGQLSIRGMQQQEQLGNLFRSRYVTETYPNFLNHNYTRVQVNVRSTDVDRTLMSVSTLLSALFPPDETQRFNESLLWQPIPIHTVAAENEYLLRGYSNCPAYSQLREADKQTAEYQQTEANNREFFTMLEKETGLETVDLTNIWSIQDTVFIQNVTEGKEAPSWATESVMATLDDLSNFALTLFFNTKAKNRLTAGVWLGKLLDDMKSKANGSNNDSKLFLYSAHDTTVASMLSGLELFNGKQPPYCTAFLVELLSRPSTPQYYVRYSLRVGPDSSDFTPLPCYKGGMCTLEQFEQFVTPLIIETSDIQQECTGGSQSLSRNSLQIAFGLTATGLGIIIIVLISIMLITYWRGNKYAYGIKKSSHSDPLISDFDSA